MRKFKEVYPGEGVRALSWKEPFASLMLHGKQETRTWDTKYRGWVLICASKANYNIRQVMDITGQTHFDRIRSALNKSLRDIRYKDFADTNGRAIAIGYLSATKFMGDYATNAETMRVIEQKCFVRFHPDLWIHEYTHVTPIVPFEWQGRQGWKTLDQETIDKIVLL